MQTRDGHNNRIAVGLSGGVDSSVSAALLQRAGYEVIGVFIRTWQPDWMTCTWRDDRREAMRVAAHLGVPFLECDLEREYKEQVAAYMVSEYREGRTPNPDVMCNKAIKFGGFLEWARAKGIPLIATGHYARVQQAPGGAFKLFRGVDSQKDQSYFLWTLTQGQLESVLFPVGSYTKNHVRTLAVKFGLPTAKRPDSQGICFLGEVDMKDFLGHYIETRPGVVLSTQGQVIGRHDGAVLYTIGERHGFEITHPSSSREAYYVIAKDLDRNTLTVATARQNIQQSFSIGSRLQLKQVNFIGKFEPEAGQLCNGQVRYRGELIPGIVDKYNRVTDELEIVLPEPVACAVGQSLVLYEGERCLGGGIIARQF